MIVVADTSPINYLVQIASENLLPALYRRVTIPSAVLDELAAGGAPAIVRDWLNPLPTWVDVSPSTLITDPGLSSLGKGEREAIQFAQEHHASLILIDERKGFLEARKRGLATTGTLGVLLSAGELGLVDAESAYRRLIGETTFRTSAALEHQFLERVRLF